MIQVQGRAEFLNRLANAQFRWESAAKLPSVLLFSCHFVRQSFLKIRILIAHHRLTDALPKASWRSFAAISKPASPKTSSSGSFHTRLSIAWPLRMIGNAGSEVFQTQSES
jgi:hypothetical protein